MRGPTRAGAILLSAVLTVSSLACASEDPPEEAPVDLTECGLPKPHADADASLIPDPFLLDGQAEVIQVEVEEGRVIAGLGLRLNVDRSFELYKAAVPEASYELLQEDNEHFEAELYIKKGKELGSLQIRGSTCPDAVIVYLNLPK